MENKIAYLFKGRLKRFMNICTWEWANSRLGYWRIADSWILHRSLTNEYLASIGYDDIAKRYEALNVHLILDKELSLKKVHGICDEVEQQIKGQFSFCEIIIHAEPNDNLLA